MTRRLLLVVLVLAAAGPARPAEWKADEAASRVVVHVFRSGVLGGLAHDHHFVPAEWSASASFEPDRLEEVRGEVIVRADSLRDNQDKLSASDREKVERQVAREVLEAERFPEVRFEIAGFKRAPQGSGGIRGTLEGTLNLHGATRPLAIPIEVTEREGGFTVRGRAAFRRSEFGIRTPSAALGTISVKDKVEVELDLALVPAARERL